MSQKNETNFLREEKRKSTDGICQRSTQLANSGANVFCRNSERQANKPVAAVAERVSVNGNYLCRMRKIAGCALDFGKLRNVRKYEQATIRCCRLPAGKWAQFGEQQVAAMQLVQPVIFNQRLPVAFKNERCNVL